MDAAILATVWALIGIAVNVTQHDPDMPETWWLTLALILSWPLLVLPQIAPVEITIAWDNGEDEPDAYA